MKFLKCIQLSTLLILASVLVLSSCQKEEIHKDEIAMTTPGDEKVFLPITADIKKKFKALNYDPEQVLKEIVQLPDGSSSEYYTILDLLYSEESLNLELENQQNESIEKQWSTGFFVAPGVIAVRGVNVGPSALSAQARAGLIRAVANYNALGLTISFNLSFGPFNAAADINAFTDSNPVPGGSSGFPILGNPFPLVRINSGTAGTTNLFEHIMTHEIGHAIGMRHTDRFCTASCGPVCVPQPAGAWIPGTPPTIQPGSIFNTCFTPGTNGEFNFWDQVALTTIY